MEDLHAAILGYLREQRPPGARVPPPGGNVLVYARVAPAGAEPGALAAQEARCRVAASRGGYRVLAAFGEVSDGRDLLRPRLTVLRGILRREEIAAVLVAGLDRLAADPALVEQLRAEWAALGVALLVAGVPES